MHLRATNIMCSCVVFQVIVPLRKWVMSTLQWEVDNERDVELGQWDGNRVSRAQQGMLLVLVSVMEILTIRVSIMQPVTDPSE